MGTIEEMVGQGKGRCCCSKKCVNDQSASSKIPEKQQLIFAYQSKPASSSAVSVKRFQGLYKRMAEGD
ncbi:hypothetical protein TYRP_020194 [Tyrophagus putrescentiae]|nr:hypothetical protein TYRP_020194 [Tyrophagus putrescentiae]